MTAIAERLRAVMHETEILQMCGEAADEIERLVTDCDRLHEFNTKLCAEVERLKAQAWHRGGT